MSDNWLTFIPTNPEAQPSDEAAAKAAKLLRSFVPDAHGKVRCKFSKRIEFHSGGANWSGVKCPKCGEDLDDWWKEAMERASESKFRHLDVSMPCCGHVTSLNDLHYVWPAGFARFVLEVMNPNISTTAEQDRALARMLDLELRKIWTHI